MATVTVHALSTGSLTLPEHLFVHPADPEAKKTVPSLSFLVQHQRDGKTTRLVFDLGLRRDRSLYPEVVKNHCAKREPMTTIPDAVESLAKGGLTIHDIDYIMLSHVHYDHVGMPSDFSDPKTKFIVGPQALDLLSGELSLPGTHSSFEPDLLPLDRSIELPQVDSGSKKPSVISSGIDQTWKSLSPFPHAIDLFSDGTVHVLNAPGHLYGHINLLCRIQQDKYVLLAGDACHDMRLFTGECDIATWTGEDGQQHCIHHDIPAAKETIKRLAEVEKNGIMIDGIKAEVEVVFAHNWQWEEDALKRNRFWPGQI